jgi:hypothetical protein
MAVRFLHRAYNSRVPAAAAYGNLTLQNKGLFNAFEEVFFEVFAGNGRVIPHEVIPLSAEAVN